MTSNDFIELTDLHAVPIFTQSSTHEQTPLNHGDGLSPNPMFQLSNDFFNIRTNVFLSKIISDFETHDLTRQQKSDIIHKFDPIFFGENGAFQLFTIHGAPTNLQKTDFVKMETILTFAESINAAQMTEDEQMLFAYSTFPAFYGFFQIVEQSTTGFALITALKKLKNPIYIDMAVSAFLSSPNFINTLVDTTFKVFSSVPQSTRHIGVFLNTLFEAFEAASVHITPEHAKLISDLKPKPARSVLFKLLSVAFNVNSARCPFGSRRLFDKLSLLFRPPSKGSQDSLPDGEWDAIYDRICQILKDGAQDSRFSIASFGSDSYPAYVSEREMATLTRIVGGELDPDRAYSYYTVCYRVFPNQSLAQPAARNSQSTYASHLDRLLITFTDIMADKIQFTPDNPFFQPYIQLLNMPNVITNDDRLKLSTAASDFLCFGFNDYDLPLSQPMLQCLDDLLFEIVPDLYKESIIATKTIRLAQDVIAIATADQQADLSGKCIAYLIRKANSINLLIGYSFLLYGWNKIEKVKPFIDAQALRVLHDAIEIDLQTMLKDQTKARLFVDQLHAICGLYRPA